VTYIDAPSDAWADGVFADAEFPSHVQEHLLTMARVHRENRYDRVTGTVESLTGQPAQTVESFVSTHAELFTPRGAAG
jgi:hypothetical protein